jgi:two-component system chemotaxis sensor kinase CheA
MNEFIEQFLIEARELIDQATDDLLALEERPGDAGRLDSVFRAFHTLKGAAGIVDFDAMGRAVHAAEEVLSQVRAGERAMTPGLVGDGLACLDQVVQWLDAMQASGEPPAGADPAADAVIARFQGSTPAPTAIAEAPDEDWAAALQARHSDVEATAALRYVPDAESFFRGEDPLALIQLAPGLAALELGPDGDWPALEDFDPFQCQLIIQALFVGNAHEIAQSLASATGRLDVVPLSPGGLAGPARAIFEEQLRLLDVSGEGHAGRVASAKRTAGNVLRHQGNRDAATRVAASDGAAALASALRTLLSGTGDPLAGIVEEAAPAQQTADPAARVLRVDVERIDALVRLTGEMSVVKNAIGHLSALAQSGDATLGARLKDQHALLERLVNELQRSVLAIRVLPMRHVFQRFPRLVRDMGVTLSKPMHLLIEGDDTEADKAVVESLFEPLLHVLRNAADHGVETAGQRAAAGKTVQATLRLSAVREGEHVLVSVEDDGGGIDLVRVRETALNRGVATREALDAMSDAETAELIFAPGFSTAATVTGLSGRGVGMDAVRTGIERLGGRVRVESVAGHGARVVMTLPFTVMITRVMTVEAGGQVFGIPLDAVVETIKLPRERITGIGAAEAIVVRGRTVPLVSLATTLSIRERPAPGRDATIVIASRGGQLCGLDVERVGEPMDVMLKPLDGLLAGMAGIAGTTLLGDGRVLLVLDLEDLL